MVPTHEQLAFEGYKRDALKALQISFPNVRPMELEQALNWSIDTRFKDSDVTVVNNYKHTKDEVTLLDLTNYILSKEPIITPSGVMFTKHGELPNPLVRMIETFLENRDIHKNEMFKYPKGSELFAAFNLAQLLDKLDANGTYGVIGARTCIYFNVFLASSVTTQGMSAISAAALLFESFLSNNVGFSSLNDLVTFIVNVTDEKPSRHWNDMAVVGTRYISRAECFRKLVITCKFGYIPTQQDLSIIWDMLNNLDDEDVRRLYYKNNLYEFIENPFVMDKIRSMLCKLKAPYVNPNKAPAEIKDDLAEFWDIIKEYVYYDKQLVDRLGKMKNIVRNVSIIMDTDSSIVSLDAWYRCVLNHTYDLDMQIKHNVYNPFIIYEYDEFGDRTDLPVPIIQVDPPLTYDFYTDEVIEREVAVNRDEIVPQDGLRYSIINIMAYCMTQMINDFMKKYVINSNALHPSKGCLFIMKNEYLFKRTLDTDGKKNYATIQEIQEGNRIPKNKQLDIKGLPINKVGLQPTIKAKLHKLLYDDVLNAAKIDKMGIIKKLAIIEHGIYDSIANGNKEYFRPVTVKSMTSYTDPMRIPGIKGSIVYNALKDDGLEAIDLTKRNSLDIVKCDISTKTINKIYETYPGTYQKMVELLQKTEFKDGISAIAIPLNVNIPKWLIGFIDYSDIINDNIKNFPLESIDLSQTPNDSVNYTNIISLN